MRVEQREEGTLVYGYLDNAAGQRPTADAVLVRADGPYHAEMRRYRFGVLDACEIASDDVVEVRSLRSLAVPDGEHELGMLMSGCGRLEQDGRLAALSPGEFVLYSGTRPFRLEFDGPHRYFLVRIGGMANHTLRAARGVTANREILDLPSARVLGAMLGEMAVQAPALGGLAARELGHHVTSMLDVVLRESSRQAPTADNVSLLERILDHVECHLGEDLPPGTVAAAHHVSVRYLHKLFQQEGDTLGDYVRRQRLERIRLDLADPALAHLPAQAIAARWGIKDPSHLSKLFRSEYGVSPREFRGMASTSSR
jgi:AraC-like DNA-binding protein